LAVLVLWVLALLLAPPGALAAGDWTWPVDGEVLTQYRNGADPYAAGQHRGIDIAAAEGEAVRAAAGGVVTFAGGVGTSGLTVSVRTDDGRFDTSYLHLGSVDVAEGEVVLPGTELGTVGTSGARSVDAPHVHFGVRDAGERHAYTDPLALLAPPGSPAPEVPPPAVPVLVPVGPLPVPAPARIPAPAPALALAPKPELDPRGAPSPAGAPLPAPLPAPRSEPRSAPHAAPRPVPGAEPARRAAGAPSPAREASPDRAPGGAPSDAGAPERGPAPALGPAAGAGADSPARMPEAGRAVSAEAPARGLDIGWVLACTGLAVAAMAALRSRRSAGAEQRRTGPVGTRVRSAPRAP
jgi:hypothetical protein